jgi:hypothetical protein
MMGLGCARRALVEALCYASSREAFEAELIRHPLMQRKLAELVVEVEAAQALVFDGYLGPRLRIGAPLIKLRAARLGITAASDAIEIHGGNGYIEQWPVARILRDAQVNPIWEGPDNILCLDVRRGIERDDAHRSFLERLRAAVAAGPAGDPTVSLVEERIGDVERAIEHWRGLDRATGEARLFPLAQLMVDVYAGALLVEQAGWEQSEVGADRRSSSGSRTSSTVPSSTSCRQCDSASSIAATSSGSSGVTIGENRATTSPSASMRNFSKFHRMSPACPSPSATAVSSS